MDAQNIEMNVKTFAVSASVRSFSIALSMALRSEWMSVGIYGIYSVRMMDHQINENNNVPSLLSVVRSSI